MSLPAGPCSGTLAAMPPAKGTVSLTLDKALELERSWSVASEDLPTDSSRIRRAVLRRHGEFTQTEIATSAAPGRDLGKATALVSQVMTTMAQLGWVFDKTPSTQKGGRSTYRLTNPTFTPTQADLDRVRAEHKKQPARAARKEAEIVERAEKRASSAVAIKRARPEPPPEMPNGLVINGHTQELLDKLPRLTEAVHVVGSFINEDGEVSMMLRSASGIRWAVEVAGATQV